MSLGLSSSIFATVLSCPIIFASLTCADFAAFELSETEHDLSSIGLLHKTLNRLVKIVYCFLVVARYCVNNTVLNMILEYDFCCVVKCRSNSGKLHEYIRAILSLLNHTPYIFKMSCCSGKPVENRFSMSMTMHMRMFARAMDMVFVNMHTFPLHNLTFN